MQLSRRLLVGGGLTLAAFCMTLVLAVWASGKKPPSGPTSAVLVLITGSLQLAGVAVLNRDGRADPGLARASLRRLLRLHVRASAALAAVEGAYDAGNSSIKQTLGPLSVELSVLGEGLLDAVDDWSSFHPDVLRKIREEGSTDDGQAH